MASCNNRGIRNSNLELYRIILMFFIIAHHYVVNSQLMETVREEMFSFDSLFILLFGAWGKTAINCFVLITGYFMVKKNITLLKFAKLFFVIIFYRFVIYIVFLFTGVIKFSFIELIEVFFPITKVESNFAGCYLLFYLLIPFINILINNMDKKKYQVLLGILLSMYVLMGSIPIMHVTMNYVSWFIVLYLIGAYLRLYPIEKLEKHSGKLFLLSIFVSAASVVLFSYIYIYTKKGYPYWAVSDSNKILALTTSITMFLFFKKIKVKDSLVINKIAASTFGVLLIHANSDAMRQWLWVDTLNNVEAFKQGYGVIHSLISVLVVYAVCSVIDIIRIQFVEKPLISKVSNRMKLNGQ